MSRKAVRRAVAILGSQQALAKKLGIRQPSVARWAVTGKVPAERVLDVVDATGGRVTKEELRPDIYPPGPSLVQAPVAQP